MVDSAVETYATSGKIWQVRIMPDAVEHENTRCILEKEKY